MSDEGEYYLDTADRAWLQTWTPDSCMPIGFIAVALWIDGEGQQRWKTYSPMEAPISTCVGLLEMAKLDILNRSHALPSYPDDA